MKNHTTKCRKYVVFTVYDLKHFQRKREIGTETEQRSGKRTKRKVYYIILLINTELIKFSPKLIKAIFWKAFKAMKTTVTYVKTKPHNNKKVFTIFIGEWDIGIVRL